jgi:uncharacterized protein YraI
VQPQRRATRLKEGEALIRRTTGDRTVPQDSGASTKRSLRVARLALLAIPLLVLAAASPVAADAVATVIPPDGLHLRAGPGTQHMSLMLLPGGTRIALTGPATDGWYPVLSQGRRGWVRAEFLDITADAGATTRMAIVRSPDGLILRGEPDTQGAKLMTMPNGATLTISARATSDGWVLAAYAGMSGWAKAEFLQTDGLTAAPPAMPGATPAAGALAPPSPSAVIGGATAATITYYDPKFEGSPMACGGRYRGEDATIAAATSWPCGTKLRVCRNGACVTVIVQDTGHMGPNWVDLSTSAFRQIAPLPDQLVHGTVEVVKE